MQISEETRSKLNELVGSCFAMNAFCDNLAYNFGYYDYRNIESIYHELFAHHFTSIVDGLTDTMLSLDTRPVRLAIPGYEKDYNGNLVEAFDENLRACEDFRNKIVATLELAEFNNDVEIKLFLEDFLEDFVPYRKQAEVWARYAHRYEGNERSFEQRFGQLTTIGANEDDDD